MKKTNLRLALPLAFLLCLLLGACASEALDPGSIRTPGVGSWYKFSSYKTNPKRALIPGSIVHDSLVIVSTGNSFSGKSNLYLFESDRRKVYLEYASNGDLMSFAEDTCECWTDWIPYAIATKETVTLPTRDTIFLPGSPDQTFFRVSQFVRYDGTESVTVPAGTFDTHKVTLVRTSVLITTYGTLTVETKKTYYFAPSIGYLARVVEREEGYGTRHPATLFISGSEEVLLGYEVK